MMINDFFDALLYPVGRGIDMLKDSRIADYLFDGKVTLWVVVCSFFVGIIFLRFLLAPFGSGISFRRSSKEDSPVDPYEKLNRDYFKYQSHRSPSSGSSNGRPGSSYGYYYTKNHS